MPMKAQPPAFVAGSWYRNSAAVVVAEAAAAVDANLRSNWPNNTLPVGESRYYAQAGAGLQDSVVLSVQRGVTEVEVAYIDFSIGGVGEYHVLQVPDTRSPWATLKYLDPGLGNVTQNGDDAAFRARLIIFAPMAGIMIDQTVASGAGEAMVVRISGRA